MESHLLEERLSQLEGQSRYTTNKLNELSVVLNQVSIELEKINKVEQRIERLAFLLATTKSMESPQVLRD